MEITFTLQYEEHFSIFLNVQKPELMDIHKSVSTKKCREYLLWKCKNIYYGKKLCATQRYGKKKKKKNEGKREQVLVHSEW